MLAEPVSEEAVSEPVSEAVSEPVKQTSLWTRVLDGVGFVFLFGFTAVALCLAIVLGPLITISSLNLLSEEARLGWYIPHTPWTYLAVYGLAIAIGVPRMPTWNSNSNSNSNNSSTNSSTSTATSGSN